MKRAWLDSAQRGDADAMRSMLGAGENPDVRDQYGQTALMLAASRGHLGAVTVLIEAGADLDHTAKYGLSALMLAVINAHDDVAELLLAAGANTRILGTGTPGFAGKTVLELARERGRERIAEILRRAADQHRDESPRSVR
jgi:ankyrin repeat protein